MEESTNEEERELEISEPEHFQFQKQEGFSHQLSVQKAYYKVEDCLAVEMVEGFWETKKDKQGNELMVYHKDTRLEAIESIKTLKNVMIADLEVTTYKPKIYFNLKKAKEIRKEYLNEQINWWNNLDYNQKKKFLNQKEYNNFVPNFLHNKLPFYHDLINEKLEIYRRIFELLELCLANTKYFKKERREHLPPIEND